MLTRKVNNQSGFTIVEVMIVLAIAGLVLAIVFIAVPALQRNSRNTQRRSDLGNLRAQFDTWIANNNSKLPDAASPADGLGSIVKSTGWGHYNGNGNLPGGIVMSHSTTPATCTGGTNTLWDPAVPSTHTSANCASDGGMFTAASTTPGNTPEYNIGYSRGLNPGSAPAFLFPDRDEVHVFGEMKCSGGILSNGNDTDTGGTNTYAATDLEASTSKALAFVYQIEGEDNARCEDNI